MWDNAHACRKYAKTLDRTSSPFEKAFFNKMIGRVYKNMWMNHNKVIELGGVFSNRL